MDMTSAHTPSGASATQEKALLDFVERGPHPVGLITLSVADGENAGRVLPTDIWYPADGAHAGRDLDPGQWPEHPLARPHMAIASAAPAAGRFPLLAFSHGNSGMRRQSTFLTTHLASWGFVVVAPDHAGNTFAEMQGLDEERRKSVHLEARRNRPRDLRAAIDAVVNLELPSPLSSSRPKPRRRTKGGLEGGSFRGLPDIDTRRIGILGHSFGGWTALKMPLIDSRVAAVCALAPAAEPFVGRKAFEPGELPFSRNVAALLIAGLDDVLVDVDKSVRTLFDRINEPRRFIGIEGADHFHFCDGIDLLHMVHAMMPRQGLPRPVRRYSELLDEARMHRILRALVTHFFTQALGTTGVADESSLRELDPALQTLEKWL